MAHFVATQPDATWVNGYAVLPADVASLDQKQFDAVDGINGGAWAPYEAQGIEIGGSGVQLTGPLILVGSGSLNKTATGKIQLGNEDNVILGTTHPGRSRSIVQPMAPFLPSHRTHWTALQRFPGAAQAIAMAITNNPQKYGLRPPFPNEFPKLWVPLRVHNGATLSSVEFRFRVATPRISAPETLPRFRVVRVTESGFAQELGLREANPSGEEWGWRSPAVPASAAAWYANGAPQGFTYLCDDPTRNVVDIATYRYFAQVEEEQVFRKENQAFPLWIDRRLDVDCASTTNVVLPTGAAAAPTIDGYATAMDTRTLLKNQTIATQNGLWSIRTDAPWVRSNDTRSNSQHTQGLIVGVKNGTVNKGSLWRIDTPAPFNIDDWNLGVATSGLINATQLQFSPLTAAAFFGNIYHSAITTFTNITDMRFE